ncbi:histamine H2 receptor-like [Oculina patagonica]
MAANTTVLLSSALQNYTTTKPSTCQTLQPFLDIEARENLPQFYIIASISACVVDFIMCFTTLMFNTVVILAIWRTPLLHQPRNVLLCSLAVSDFFVGLTTQPSFLVAEISLLFGNMELYCLTVFIHFYTSWIFNGVSFLTLSAISFERYLALRFHLRYAELITTTRVCITVIIYWSIWVTWITLEWFWARNKLLTYILIALCMLIATIDAWCYFIIYKTVKRHNKQIQDSQQHTHQSMVRYRRTTNTMIILISAFALSYFPFLITTAISATQEKEDMRTSAAHCLAVVVIFANSTANPLIYFWRVAELRETAKQTFRKFYPMKMEQEDVELDTR